MTKRINAKHKIDRRLKVNLWGRPKSPFNTRAYPPGQHGQNKRGKPTDYGIQLFAKQKLKSYYGNINERQFRNIYRKALTKRGDTTENLIGLIESRLDTVIYRGKFTSTVFAARQLINHGHVRVNKKKVNISSYLVKETDVIEIKEKSKLKAGKGKITVDLNWDGTARDKKFAETKYGIKLKITRTGALATGEKARVLAYVSGQDYAMDDADIEDLMPEILEARGSDLSSAELKKAEKIAKKHSGDMKKAMAEIEKIKKGSSESDAVMTMIKKHNEDTTEDMYMHTSKKKRKLKAHKGDHMDEAVSVDRRTMGFKEAMKRRAEAKAKREAKKIKDAKSQAKSDMASIDANYAYDGDVAEILASANKSIMGQHEDAAANASSSGAVDMNTNGKSVKKKKDKENLMAKYGY